MSLVALHSLHESHSILQRLLNILTLYIFIVYSHILKEGIYKFRRRIIVSTKYAQSLVQFFLSALTYVLHHLLNEMQKYLILYDIMVWLIVRDHHRFITENVLHCLLLLLVCLLHNILQDIQQLVKTFAGPFSTSHLHHAVEWLFIKIRILLNGIFLYERPI